MQGIDFPTIGIRFWEVDLYLTGRIHDPGSSSGPRQEGAYLFGVQSRVVANWQQNGF
jgi:hypothetical protein